MRNETGFSSAKRCTVPSSAPERPEPTTARGEILVTHNQIAVLNGLYDRPQGTSFSTFDLGRAALPYLRLFRDDETCHHMSIVARRMHESWIRSFRVGARRIWEIRDRGRDIVELRVPVWLRGHGPYRGMARLRAELAEKARKRELASRRRPSYEGKSLEPWLGHICRILDAWKARQHWDTIQQLLYIQRRAEELDTFLRIHVLEFDQLPSGSYEIESSEGPSFTVDFDGLGGDG